MFSIYFNEKFAEEVKDKLDVKFGKLYSSLNNSIKCSIDLCEDKSKNLKTLKLLFVYDPEQLIISFENDSTYGERLCAYYRTNKKDAFDCIFCGKILEWDSEEFYENILNRLIQF